jgi:1-phosphatidylinositol-3-phosphate 5-kinase
MESTASKATSLAKMMGFYSVEVKNLETGVVLSQADLMVMENLFYGQKISKVFDLKGIPGRKIKPRNRESNLEGAPKTMFDSEWIEGKNIPLRLRGQNQG